MPRSWLWLLACSTAFCVGFQEPDDGLPPLGEPAARPRVVVPAGAVAADPGSVELAGLPEGSRAEVLTWERAYKLALVRARAESGKGPARAATLDPRGLDDEARRVGFADFTRFRLEFLDARMVGPKGFRDPAPAMLELVRLARAHEDAQRGVLAYERYVRTAIELARGDPAIGNAPGMNRLDEGLERARVDLLGRTRRYRDGLDAMKVELGLSPEAPVVPDRAILAAFGEVFDKAEAWIESPERDLGRLDRIALELPKLDDIAIEGRSIFEEQRRASHRIEDLLRAAARVAIANRDARGGERRPGDDDDAPTLRVRREIRALHETWLDYHIGMREFVLLIRQVEQAREAYLKPAPHVPIPEWGTTSNLIDVQARLLQGEDRLVAHWTGYQAQRLALLRDLGALPADDWPGFFATLTARKGGPGPR